MAYFLDKDHMNKYFDLPNEILWPIQIDIPSMQTTFYFKDRADYLTQRENNPLVKKNVILKGMDY